VVLKCYLTAEDTSLPLLYKQKLAYYSFLSSKYLVSFTVITIAIKIINNKVIFRYFAAKLVIR